MNYISINRGEGDKISSLMRVLRNLDDDKLKACGLPNDTRETAEFMLAAYGIEEIDDIPSLTLDNLNISPELMRALKRAGINTINQLLLFTKNELLFLRGIGKERVDQIEKALKEKGIYLKDKHVIRQRALKDVFNEESTDEDRTYPSYEEIERLMQTSDIDELIEQYYEYGEKMNQLFK